MVVGSLGTPWDELWGEPEGEDHGPGVGEVLPESHVAAPALPRLAEDPTGDDFALLDAMAYLEPGPPWVRLEL